MSATLVETPLYDIRIHVLQPLASASFEAPALGIEESPLDAACREAYERGLTDGQTQTQETLLHAAEALAAALDGVRREHRTAQENLKRDMLTLSMAIARQVVMSEVRTRPDVIAEIVTRLVEDAEDRKIFAVRLHSDDAVRLKDTAAGRALEEAHIAIQPSDEVSPGGCVLETGFGRLDARLETRLEEIASGLLGHRDLGSHSRANTPAPNRERTI